MATVQGWDGQDAVHTASPWPQCRGGVDGMLFTLPVHGHSAGVGWTGCRPHSQSMATVQGWDGWDASQSYSQHSPDSGLTGSTDISQASERAEGI